MPEKEKGFTLIEMLIVVAIIGILAALLIPNALGALQKARVRGTQKDISTLATTLMDYLTDKADFTNLVNSGAISAATLQKLTGIYSKALSTKDQWGFDFQLYTGTAADGNYGLANSSNDDYLVFSYGRDGTAEAFTYDAARPDAGLYTINRTSDFDKDIVNWNGSVIRGPRTGTNATT